MAARMAGDVAETLPENSYLARRLHDMICNLRNITTVKSK